MQLKNTLNRLETLRIVKFFQSSITQKILIAYGTYQLLRKVIPKIESILIHFLWKPNLLKKYGKCWAVITGAANGLGRAYAQELAQCGFNIILIGRNLINLQATQKLIKNKFNVQVEVIVFDFDQYEEIQYTKLVQQIINIGEIGILINNVGTFEMHPFEQENKTNSLININVIAGTYLSQKLVPYMKQRNNKSLLVFIGSETGENPHSGCAIQAATKAYVGHLARSLYIELKPQIDVRLVTPGPTLTGLLNANPNYLTLKNRFFACTPEDVAQQSLRKLTYQIHTVVQPGLLDLSSYNLPKTDSLSVRIQENFSKYGVRYGQIIVVAVAIGGFTNFWVLLTLFLSYVSWAYITKQTALLDFIPDLGFINSQDKKMILLLLFNVLLILAISGPHILTFVGMGCLIVILHASLWKSPSTQPGQDIQAEFDKVLIQNDVELTKN